MIQPLPYPMCAQCHPKPVADALDRSNPLWEPQNRVSATIPTCAQCHREGFAQASEHVSITTGGDPNGAPTEFDAAMGHTPAGIVRFLRDSQPKA
jgi:hypothetical protein